MSKDTLLYVLGGGLFVWLLYAQKQAADAKAASLAALAANQPAAPVMNP